MKPHVNPVSAEDREKLFTFARKWQDLLSLHRWRLAPSNERTDGMAEVKFSKDNSNKLARLLVGAHFGAYPVNDEELEMTALHEVLHILMHEFKEACIESPYDENRKMEAEHGIIHVLEKLLYELWHCKHVELSQELPVHRSKHKRT